MRWQRWGAPNSRGCCPPNCVHQSSAQPCAAQRHRATHLEWRDVDAVIHVLGVRVDAAGGQWWARWHTECGVEPTQLSRERCAAAALQAAAPPRLPRLQPRPARHGRASRARSQVHGKPAAAQAAAAQARGEPPQARNRARRGRGGATAAGAPRVAGPVGGVAPVHALVAQQQRADVVPRRQHRGAGPQLRVPAMGAGGGGEGRQARGRGRGAGGERLAARQRWERRRHGGGGRRCRRPRCRAPSSRPERRRKHGGPGWLRRTRWRRGCQSSSAARGRPAAATPAPSAAAARRGAAAAACVGRLGAARQQAGVGQHCAPTCHQPRLCTRCSPGAPQHASREQPARLESGPPPASRPAAAPKQRP